MKTFEVEFLHTDKKLRNVKIEAFNKERAEGRFIVNWGSDMIINKINLLKV